MSEVYGLLRYEFKKNMSSVVLTGACIAMLSLYAMFPTPTIPPICIFLLTTSLYLTDNFNGYLELVTSLPVKKSSVVIARYLHSFIITIVITLLPFLSRNEAYNQNFSFTFLVLSLYVVCNLPLVMISHKYSNVFSILGYLIMLGLTGTFSGITELLGLKNLDFNVTLSFFTAFQISLVCWILSLAVSIFLFSRSYAKREGK